MTGNTGNADRRRRILVVDDEPALANTLALLLRDRNEVVVATSGREGLELVLADPAFDAVLCDLTMPVVSGMDIYDRLRSARPEAAKKIVFMTGGSFTKKMSDFLATVNNPILEKPFSIDAVEAILRALDEG